MDYLKYWPRALTLLLAGVPVLALAIVVFTLGQKSIDAVRFAGIGELFGTEVAVPYGSMAGGIPVYGLIPAIWGTLLLVAVAMAIALPASIAIAVFATEYPLGFLGKGVSAVLGVLSGIPPMVYALMSVVFAEVVLRPKLCAPSLDSNQVQALPGLTWYSPGLLPRSESMLLGAFVLALMVIPFIAPLIIDAIRNVPYSMKEASLALGADRWYTVRRVMLPVASIGLVGAASLGVLLAAGDVLIVAWSVGFEPMIASPPFDVFERMAPLTTTGAGLSGGLSEGGGCGAGLACSVAYFTGALLLLFAFVVIGAATLLQHRLKRRLTS